MLSICVPCVEDYNKGDLCDVILHNTVSKHRSAILSAWKISQQLLVKHPYLSVSEVVDSSKRQGEANILRFRAKRPSDGKFIVMRIDGESYNSLL